MLYDEAFVATDRLTSENVMSSPRLAFFFTNMITDGITDGTPVGNNGLVQALLCNSASRKILPRMGKTIVCSCAQFLVWPTGKPKVGRNANFVLIRKSFSYWKWKAQTPTSQCLSLRIMTSIEPRTLFEIPQKMRPRVAVWSDSKNLVISPKNGLNTNTQTEHEICVFVFMAVWN